MKSSNTARAVAAKVGEALFLRIKSAPPTQAGEACVDLSNRTSRGAICALPASPWCCVLG